MQIKKIKIIASSFALLFTLQLAHAAQTATDLTEVMRDGFRHDPIFRAAKSDMMSVREAFPQARSALLPTLSGFGTLERNRRFNDSGIIEDTQHFSDHNYALSVTQPVFNLANWTRLLEANAIVKQAIANYSAAAQDLMIRTSLAYFDVLDAQETLRFTNAEKKANAKQLDQAKERFKVGIDPITSVHEAQASYDAVVANEIAARNAVINNKEALREITGKYYQKLAKLNQRRLPLVKPDPVDVNTWVMTAKRQNYAFRAARYGAISAKHRIKTSFAGHVPTLDFIASADDVRTVASTDTNIETRTQSYGLQVNVPIFQGGLVVSQTRQARYDYQTAIADAQTALRQTVSQTRQSYNNVISGIGRIKADRQAVVSAQSSLSSSEASFRVGTRTFVDVLDAQRDLYDVQRQLASDQFGYINSILALKQAAGTLAIRDIFEVNSWLKSGGRKYSK